jgi:hypothetical protein
MVRGDVEEEGSMNPFVRRAIALWIPSVVVAGVLSFLVYATVQQSYRNGANDPQLQMANDAAGELSSGSVTPAALTAGPSVDIASSLAPYTTVFDASGRPIASTATLDGSTPVPPPGVLESAKTDGIDVVTWQPRAGVRQAIVVVPYRSGSGDGTVLVGRSLTEVEHRESELVLMAGLALLFALGASAVGALIGAWIWGRSAGPAPPATAADVRDAA